VVPDGPAAKAGLQAGDVIVEAAGHPIHSAHDLPRIVAESKVGSKLDLTVKRDAKKQTFVAMIGELPKQQASVETGATMPSPMPSAALGLELAPLGPELRQELKLGSDVHGVVVMRIAPGTPVAATWLEPGDVIQSVDQKPVTTPAQVALALANAAKARQHSDADQPRRGECVCRRDGRKRRGPTERIAAITPRAAMIRRGSFRRRARRGRTQHANVAVVGERHPDSGEGGLQCFGEAHSWRPPLEFEIVELALRDRCCRRQLGE
jgi:membrane-associated protease RseP (regulator of RpoE activity)